jgi:hypothetical protein
MAGLVPAIQTRDGWMRIRDATAADLSSTAAFMGGRDEPGHDVRSRD